MNVKAVGKCQSNIHINASKSTLIGPEYSPPLCGFVAVAELSIYWRQFAERKSKSTIFRSIVHCYWRKQG